MSNRLKKVNELLRHQISELLLKEVDFEGILVTLTRVETSTDLRQAKVGISVLPQEKKEVALRILQRNIFDLQQKLNKKLFMRPVPKIIFEIDKTEAKAQEVEEILGRIKKEQGSKIEPESKRSGIIY